MVAESFNVFANTSTDYNETSSNVTNSSQNEVTLTPLDVSKIFLSALGAVINLATVITLFKHGKGFSPKSKLLLQHQVRRCFLLFLLKSL